MIIIKRIIPVIRLEYDLIEKESKERINRVKLFELTSLFRSPTYKLAD